MDGVLHYATHLAKHYTVVAVAVSGSTANSLKVSNFLLPAGGSEAKQLVNEASLPVTDIIPYDDYYRLASFDPDVAKKRHSDLLAFSKELHELIWTKAKISEEDKPLLVSGTLIALMNATFMKTYSALPADEVQEAWLGAIKKELDRADSVPYVGASDSANGVTARIGQAPIHEGGTISVSYNGSVAEAFYQPEPFWATDDVNVLYPKGFNLTPQPHYSSVPSFEWRNTALIMAVSGIWSV